MCWRARCSASAGRLRVNVQLIDAETASHLWAERFDKPVADFFDLQDEIVARLANQLNPSWSRSRPAAPTPPARIRWIAISKARRGNEGKSPEASTEARGFFEQALALDPGNLEALAGLSQVEANLAISLSATDKPARFAAAEAAAAEALSLAPDHASAHLCMGMVLGFTNRAAQGIAEYERALRSIATWQERMR